MCLRVVSYLPLVYEGMEETERPAICLARIGQHFVVLLPREDSTLSSKTMEVCSLMPYSSPVEGCQTLIVTCALTSLDGVRCPVLSGARP